MREPYLANYVEEHEYNQNNSLLYDGKTQLSFIDPEKKLRAIDKCLVGPTYLTKAVENSDPDEFQAIGPTIETATDESSDPDEFYAIGPTKLTFSDENSDPDEFYLLGPSKESRSNECSDPDEFYLK
ncbi:hypothetical protein [Desulfosporosinus shakirovi]|uniref:hypothetical protein n=1 Tax=Desulfosporosinus shakirovi TaxID=2885154 RepID=UPI001E5C3C22|nr:hypothetical protein [Desulfosporosinus sp. SRJS8]MCB8818631.1 hypothetical protein [Desulfosporosinus sp. SRJS8]